MLQSMGLQRVGHDLATKQPQQSHHQVLTFLTQKLGYHPQFNPLLQHLHTTNYRSHTSSFLSLESKHICPFPAQSLSIGHHYIFPGFTRAASTFCLASLQPSLILKPKKLCKSNHVTPQQNLH